MKNTLKIFILIFAWSPSLKAQTKISSEKRICGVWSDLRNEWDIVNKEENSTTFEFNENYTFLTHFTSSGLSIFKTRLQKYDEKNRSYNFEAISDSGNKYNLIVDYEKKKIRFIYKDEHEKTRLVQHDIKTLVFAD
ncbi:hypothetical protein [Abyssalbus ytuae]|uniref:Uncharacterized protein n=1 Tax=Abyssalbus ytuae TaxID=2926907 RepID=A0A9E6ZK84_9FLAO|nr:hypothetical protein [Abyssalbus ytuae]UOB17189.1 hypothetical protein MQE35_15785 [Abyssalbus ytuae]